MPKIVPVILCGGKGARLWPLSRESYPKQFVDLGDGRTLFGDTIKRAINIPNSQPPIIVCNESHRFYVSSELKKYGVKGSVILEPEGRNTAPAITLASFLAADNKDSYILVLPSDHTFKDESKFLNSISKAVNAAYHGCIVTFGIIPSRPETGFGYIKRGELIEDDLYKVSKFIEKPNLELAKEMISDSVYYWNSGMYLMRPDIYSAELLYYSKPILESCIKAWENHIRDGEFIRPDKESFLNSPSESVDYAVMEHTNMLAVIPLYTEWSDLGSWESFYQIGNKDSNGNVALGDTILLDTENCYCKSTDRMVATIGLKDTLVVETKDAVLVASRDRSQSVKNIVKSLKKNDRSEYEHHRLVYRPWGSYETLSLESRFQVKKIVVNPGQELSLQMHHHRSEHWVIVSGTAEITNGDSVKLFTENQSTYIPVGTKHRLKNPGVIPLVLIEIQSGAYLGEDDIVRFEDIYGRGI